MDGCSATYTLKRDGSKFKYVVASRNRVADQDSVYHVVSKKYNLETKLKTIFYVCEAKDNVTIQGEIIGPKIQGNKYKRDEPEFFVFNVIVDGVRMSTSLGYNIATAYGLRHVPIIDGNFILPDTVDEMLKLADGKSLLADTLREGFVIRSLDGKTSFKAVSNKFLLKNNE